MIELDSINYLEDIKNCQNSVYLMDKCYFFVFLTKKIVNYSENTEKNVEI